jgi:hypothetical protein
VGRVAYWAWVVVFWALAAIGAVIALAMFAWMLGV